MPFCRIVKLLPPGTVDNLGVIVLTKLQTSMKKLYVMQCHYSIDVCKAIKKYYNVFQCKTLLPPKDIDTECLIELHFTGGRKLSLCAHDIDSAKYETLKSLLVNH